MFCQRTNILVFHYYCIPKRVFTKTYKSYLEYTKFFADPSLHQIKVWLLKYVFICTRLHLVLLLFRCLINEFTIEIYLARQINWIERNIKVSTYSIDRKSISMPKTSGPFSSNNVKEQTNQSECSKGHAQIDDITKI